MSIYSFNQNNDDKKVNEDNSTEVVKTAVGDEVSSSIKDIAVSNGKDSDKEKVIVVDGPLSEVYTKALNIALANESIMAVAAISGNHESNKEQNNESYLGDDAEIKKAEYVYVLGDRIKNDQDAMEAYNYISSAVSSKKYSNVYLAFEGAVSKGVGRRLSVVMEGLMGMGVKVIARPNISTEDAVASLSSYLKR